MFRMGGSWVDFCPLGVFVGVCTPCVFKAFAESVKGQRCCFPAGEASSAFGFCPRTVHSMCVDVVAVLLILLDSTCSCMA